MHMYVHLKIAYNMHIHTRCHLTLSIPTSTFYVVTHSIPTTTFCVVIAYARRPIELLTRIPMMSQNVCMCAGPGHLPFLYAVFLKFATVISSIVNY